MTDESNPTAPPSDEMLPNAPAPGAEPASGEQSAPEQQPTEQPDRQAMPVDDEQPPRLPFPVVGVGASAGGLEAFIDFISVVPPDSGMAFVLVQHLPPDRESMMPEIVARKTAMPVSEVKNNQAVEVNHVYTIRPGHVLTIRDGRFHLGEQLGRRGAGRPVDDFFKSLAEEQRERAIAVVLSGMGSNGAVGAQAIKAVGGLCIAQDPETAQFPSMPQHLIEAGYADYVLHAVDMAEVLLTYARHPYARDRGTTTTSEAALRRDNNYLREVLAILRTRTRQDFSGYKKPTILRRVQRRMGLTRTTRLTDYAKLLRQSPNEVSALGDDLLIHVTGFFRDADAWEALRQQVVIPLVAAREPGASIRCWVNACSSGEEAYSLAMLLVEEIDRSGKRLDVKVFATDMAERAMGHARAGIYPGGIEEEMPQERLDRFFEKEDAVYRVRQDLRERVLFAPQNVLQDPPFSRMDIISCRNLLIYLEPEVQQRLLALLHFGLREGGALFLGASETITGAEDLFEPIDKKARLFRRVGPTRHGALDFPVRYVRGTLDLDRRGAVGRGGGDDSIGDVASLTGLHPRGERRAAPRLTLAQLTHRTLLEQHTPAAVTVDRDHRVLFYHGNTRPFLSQPPGEPTRDLMLLVREGVRGATRVALHRAAAEGEKVTVLDGWLEVEPGRQARVAVVVSPVTERGETPDYFVVSFEERGESVPTPGAKVAGDKGDDDKGDGNGDGNGEAVAISEELRRVRAELQGTIEELQTSNEELRASNEEVTSMNEELQSTNEELETSKEEMQSLNEELTTVNAQLQSKMQEHQSTTSDLQSLLASTDIAVLFLDTRLRIRRYTPAVRELIEVIRSDTGRPLSDLNRKFEDPQLDHDARTVLERLVPVEREVSAGNGRTYIRRILPYRTVDDRIDGVVITFVDNTERSRADTALRVSEEQFRRTVEDAPIPVIMQADDGQVLQLSRTWTELTGYALSDLPTMEAWTSRAYGPGGEMLRTHLRELFKGNRQSLDVQFAIHTRSGEERHWSFSASAPGVLLDGRRFIVGMALDVTERTNTESARRVSEEQFRTIADRVPDLLWQSDAAGQVRWYNRRWYEYTGQAPDAASGEGWLQVVHPEDRERSQAAFRRSIKGGQPLRLEHRIRRADGDYRWFIVQGLPQRDEAGHVTAWFGSAIDVHEQRATMGAVRESERHLRALMDNVRDYAISTMDPQGRITSWNPGAERIFRYTAKEIIGRDASILFTPEDQAAGVPEQELATAAREGRAGDDRWQMRKGGERFWASGVSTPARDEAGQLTGFIKILRDETDRKNFEEQLQRSKEQLEQRVGERTEALQSHQQQLRSLVAQLSSAEIRQRKLLATELHDNLAQLLAVRKMRIAAIEAAAPPEGTARKEAGVVKDSLGEAIAYTRTLMSDLRPDVLDEHDLTAAVEWVALRMARHGLKVRVTDDGKPKPMGEDLLGFLYQAIRELLWNVVKHARTNDATVTIERGDGELRVVVADTGTGFSPARRTKLPSEEGGYGLFSIAERLSLFGGKMDVQSTRNRGTRVTLIAPLDAGADDSAAKAGS